LRWQEINKHILGVLENASSKLCFFVCGKRIDSVEGRQLLAEWNTAGHAIGNHTYRTGRSTPLEAA